MYPSYARIVFENKKKKIIITVIVLVVFSTGLANNIPELTINISFYLFRCLSKSILSKIPRDLNNNNSYFMAFFFNLAQNEFYCRPLTVFKC